jgi:hypothetical protein
MGHFTTFIYAVDVHVDASLKRYPSLLLLVLAMLLEDS